MSKSLNEKRDELASEYVKWTKFERETGNPYKARRELAFKEGFDAAEKFFAEAAGEFDAAAFDKEYYEQQDSEDGEYYTTPKQKALYMARWQFEKCLTEIGLMKLELAEARAGIEALKSELDEQCRILGLSGNKELQLLTEIERLKSSIKAELLD